MIPMAMNGNRLRSENGYAGVLQFLALSLISSAVLGSIYMAFTSSQASWLTADALMAAQDRARHALYDIGLDLRGSGNEAAVIHLRVHEPDSLFPVTYSGGDHCPTLIYQIPFDSGSFASCTSGWGAIDPGVPGTPCATNGVAWIHRARDATGDISGNNLCTGPVLVRQIFASASSLAVGASLPTGAAQSTRVIASRLAGQIDAFQTQALDDTSPTANRINWWTIADPVADWDQKVRQVDLVVRTEQRAVGGRTVISEQRMRIRLRNTP